MKVRVISKKFGAYEVGDEIEMHESTAKAVAKHGHVELIEDEKGASKKKAK